MSDTTLVIDIGTQSLRASLVDSEKGILEHVQKKYEQPYFSVRKDYAEQEPDYYLTKLIEATNELKRNSPEDFQSVKSMVVVAFRDTSVILDEEKKPIRPSILWLDQRTAKLKNLYNLKWYEKLLFRAIGMYDAVKYNSMRTASFWIKENEPENWKKMRHYVPLTAYFNYRMTGNLVVSSADCIGHYPVNFKKGTWFPSWHPKVDVFGIPLKALPPLVKPGTIIGRISKEFSALSGIQEGLPLIASGSDKACETFGNGAIDPMVGSISLGTACSIDVVSDKYKEPETFLPSYGTPYPGFFDYEVQIYRGLWMVRWFSEQFGETDLVEAKRENLSVEEFLDKKIASILPGSDGLVLQPYWGPGLARPLAKGTVIGWSDSSTSAHFYRAIIEGICYALRESFESFEKKVGHRIPVIRVSGGGANSPAVCQIAANIFNRPIERVQTTETSSLGAAIATYLAAGVFKDPKEAVGKMVHLKDRFEPDENVARKYDRLFHDVYLQLFPSLRKVYRNIKAFNRAEDAERLAELEAEKKKAK